MDDLKIARKNNQKFRHRKEKEQAPVKKRNKAVDKEEREGGPHVSRKRQTRYKKCLSKMRSPSCEKYALKSK